MTCNVFILLVEHVNSTSSAKLVDFGQYQPRWLSDQCSIQGSKPHYTLFQAKTVSDIERMGWVSAQPAAMTRATPDFTGLR